MMQFPVMNLAFTLLMILKFFNLPNLFFKNALVFLTINEIAYRVSAKLSHTSAVAGSV